LTMISFFFVQFLMAQNENWREAKVWRIYAIRSRDAFTCSVDTLSLVPSLSLSVDSMKRLLANAVPMAEAKTPVWMGSYVSTCLFTNGTLKKIVISTYGGFFYDEMERKYYQLPPDLRAEWLNYLSDCAANLRSSN